MEILFAALMISLFLPKYRYCMNESFLSKSALEAMGMRFASLNCDFIVDLEQAFENK